MSKKSQPLGQPYAYIVTDFTVVDGDTIAIAELDLGFSVILTDVRLRLARINAPEMSTPEGIKSKEYLENLIVNKPLIIKSIKNRQEESKKDKYGRYLVELLIMVDTPDGQKEASINDLMLNSGYAIVYS